MVEPEHSRIEFSSALPDEDLMVELCSSAFGVEVSDSLRRSVLSTLRGQEVRTIVIDGEVAGFMSYNINFVGPDHNRKSVYLKGIAVAEQFHGAGALTQGLERILEEEQPDFVGLATQSPRVYETLARVVGNPYPHFDGRETPAALLEIATEIAGYENMLFPKNPGRYGGALYGRMPKSGDSAIQTFFEKLCPQPEAGDNVFVVCEVTQKPAV